MSSFRKERERERGKEGRKYHITITSLSHIKKSAETNSVPAPDLENSNSVPVVHFELQLNLDISLLIHQSLKDNLHQFQTNHLLESCLIIGVE